MILNLLAQIRSASVFSFPFLVVNSEVISIIKPLHSFDGGRIHLYQFVGLQCPLYDMDCLGTLIAYEDCLSFRIQGRKEMLVSVKLLFHIFDIDKVQ